MGPVAHGTSLPCEGHIALLIIALSIGCVTPGTVPVRDFEPGQSATARELVRDLEDEVAALVNEHRRGIGLTALREDPLLSEIAREHSRAMAGGRRNFGHEDFSARGDRIHDELRAVSVSENVAYNNYPPDKAAERVVRGWVRSRGHRENLEGDYNRGGVGVAATPDGMWFVTQLYALVPR